MRTCLSGSDGIYIPWCPHPQWEKSTRPPEPPSIPQMPPNQNQSPWYLPKSPTVSRNDQNFANSQESYIWSDASAKLCLKGEIRSIRKVDIYSVCMCASKQSCLRKQLRSRLEGKALSELARAQSLKWVLSRLKG